MATQRFVTSIGRVSSSARKQADTVQRIGVFSGTFDPTHMGHIEACLVAKSVLNLKTVLVLIEKKPRRKSSVTDYKHRFEMLDQSLSEYPSLQIADVGADNITTNNCLQLLNDRFKDSQYWYIVGSDMLEHLTSWPDADRLLQNFNICVVLRDNKEETKTQKALEKLQDAHPGMQYKLLPAVWSDVSSSSVKAELKNKGQSKNIHKDALTYIYKHKLYN